MGYIVRDKHTDSRTFTGCTLVQGGNAETSRYWDTRGWANLFDGGRDGVNDFSFVNDNGDGLQINVWQLYF